MQTIRAGGVSVPAETIYSERKFVGDILREIMRVVLPDNTLPTAEQITALSGNEWHIHDQEDNLEGVHIGYNDMLPLEIQFAKVDGSSEQVAQLTAEKTALIENISDMKTAANDYLQGKRDDSLAALLPLMADWSLYDGPNESAASVYAVGDARKYLGQPYTCGQAHTTAGDPNRAPDKAPSLWAVYHAKSAEYALPFVPVTGAHDLYKADEYMIWTDGSIQRCKQDTAYSPVEYAQAWETVTP